MPNRQVNRILGIDPGGTTGLCHYSIQDNELKPSQLGPQEHHIALYDVLGASRADIIVCERFDYRASQSNADLTPVEYIGVINLFSQKTGVEVVYQNQLKGHKGLWTDKKLKALGLYVPNLPHGMDAIRQVLFFVTVTMGHEYWLHRYKEKTNEGDEAKT